MIVSFVFEFEEKNIFLGTRSDKKILTKNQIETVKICIFVHRFANTFLHIFSHDDVFHRLYSNCIRKGFQTESDMIDVMKVFFLSIEPIF